MKKLILIWIFVIFSSVVVGLTVNDVGISGLNYVINSTGIFAGSSSVQPNGYVTVCLDANECDYPCTDGDCTPELQDAIDNAVSIIINNGFYNLDGNLNLTSNLTIIGEPATVLNVSSNFNIEIAQNEDTRNIYIDNLHFISPVVSAHGPLFNITGATNIENIRLKNLIIENWNATFTMQIQTKISATGNVSDVVIENINLKECRGGVQLKETSSERKNRIRNIKINNIRLENNDLWDEHFTEDGFAVTINGGDTVSVTNIHIRKSSDGPAVIIRRTNNAVVENVYSYDQQDYAVEVTDGSKNVKINNIQAINPINWGILYIDQTNFVDEMSEILASNLYCLNCSNNTAHPAILINHQKGDGEPIRNVVLENIYINNSGALGAITIQAKNGDIEGLVIRNGIIENTNNAGIHINSRNLSTNVLIENMVFRNNGNAEAVDGDRRAAIVFYNANATDYTFRDVEIVNNSEMLYGVRVLADTGVDATRRTEAYFERMSFSGSITPYSSFGSGAEIYADDLTYTSLPECTANERSDGQVLTLDNTTHYLLSKCVSGAWYNVSMGEK